VDATEIALIVAVVVTLGLAVRYSRLRAYSENPSRAGRNEADQQFKRPS
jgi:hypothetical protein